MGAALCPVKFIQHYLNITADIDNSYPLLMHPREGARPLRCVTRLHVTAAIKSAAVKLGIDPKGLGCHAVRTGHVAALLASPFVTVSDRQVSGGWVSEMGSVPYHRANGPSQRRVADALAISSAVANVGTGAASGWSPAGTFGVGGLLAASICGSPRSRADPWRCRGGALCLLGGRRGGSHSGATRLSRLGWRMARRRHLFFSANPTTCVSFQRPQLAQGGLSGCPAGGAVSVFRPEAGHVHVCCSERTRRVRSAEANGLAV